VKKEIQKFYAIPPKVVKCRIKGIRPNYNVLVSFCLNGCREKDCERKKKRK
jgi:hypothetical protein